MHNRLFPLFLLITACEKLPEASAPVAPSAPATPAAGAPITRATETVSAVDVAGLKSAMDAGPIHLVDVRTSSEYASGHVPGAINIPLSDLDRSVGELEGLKGEAVYLICARGGRSAQATAVLAVKGFQQPINVEGGTMAWTEAGYAIE
jgi:rhodanese-related sulfurtransferase